MELVGRISRLFETREGVSIRTGQPWKALPFIFEFIEHDGDKKYSSFVRLETFNTSIMEQIGQFVVKDENGKAIIKDDCMELTKNVEVRCVLRLNVNMYNGRVYNEVNLQKMEVLTTDDKPASEATDTTAGNLTNQRPAESSDNLTF